ncbi:MAG: membrane protein insertion efficiency factor YidD [Ignavibacteriae bacterium]|nr:membrane protein insertion efficiency factor YidD [Ignavibacteriota bacterium]
MRNVLIYFIKFYQKAISPMFPPSCRFYPSCSNYAIDSFNKYGVIKGGIKSIWRILRCNPFNKGGYDPA